MFRIKYKNIILWSFDNFRSFITDWNILILEWLNIEWLKKHSKNLKIEVKNEYGSNIILKNLINKLNLPLMDSFKLLMNIRNYWFNKQGQIHKKRKADYKNIIDKHKLSKHIIMSNLHSQAIYGNERKLTGEWLIYTRVQEVNYFLCLASHTEGDNSIYENKIKECYNEFPELM